MMDTVKVMGNFLGDDQRRVCEEQIRSVAHTVLNKIAIRDSHPSYGYTKTIIRADFRRMEGAIGLYMVLTGQANHTDASMLAEFGEPETTDIVTRVRSVMRGF